MHMIRKSYYPIIKDDDLLPSVENYQAALLDTSCTWHLHHRNAILFGWNFKEMKENGIYKYCEPDELIFLTPCEHYRLHAKARTAKNT